MSFLVGPVSGALVAGGIYYGFSTLIQTRTEQHQRDLHILSQRFLEPTPSHPAPTPASQRIVQHPFSTLLKHQWNDKLAALYKRAGAAEERIADWTRNTLYGGPGSPADLTPHP